MPGAGCLRLQDRPWRGQVELVEGDVLRDESLRECLRGVSVAYYLIYSLAAGSGFAQQDVRAARNFGTKRNARGSRGSSISAASVIPAESSQLICARARIRAMRCGKVACP